MASITHSLNDFFRWLRTLGPTVPWERLEEDLPFPWLRPFYTSIHTKSLVSAQYLGTFWPLPKGFVLKASEPWLPIPAGTPTAHQALGWLVRLGVDAFLKRHDQKIIPFPEFETWPQTTQKLYQNLSLLEHIFFNPERVYVNLGEKSSLFARPLAVYPTRGQLLCDLGEAVISLQNPDLYQAFAALIEALSGTNTRLRVLARQPLFGPYEENIQGPREILGGYEGRFSATTPTLVSCQEVYAPGVLETRNEIIPPENRLWDKLMGCLF